MCDSDPHQETEASRHATINNGYYISHKPLYHKICLNTEMNVLDFLNQARCTGQFRLIMTN